MILERDAVEYVKSSQGLVEVMLPYQMAPSFPNICNFQWGLSRSMGNYSVFD